MQFWSWGVPIRLEGPHEAVRALRARLPRGRARTRLEEPAHFRWTGRAWMRGNSQTVDLEKAMELEVATRAPEHVFVHAGVVRFGHQALLLPGESLAGKSTLVRELVRRGGSYYSDEFAVLDSRGRVEPYPRPLCLRSGESIPASELGWSPRQRAVRIAWVVDCRYAGSLALQPVTRGQAVLSCFANAVAARSRPAAILNLLGRALAEARFLQGERGEVQPAAHSILHWLGKEG